MINKIKEYTENGMSSSRIAEKLQIERNKVINIIKTEGFEIKKEPFDDGKISKIIELYIEGVSPKILASKYSIDRRRVVKWVSEKCKLRTMKESRKFINFDEHKMDIIDSADKAYWLGMFYADAYNGINTNTFSLILCYEDLGHIKKCAKFFSYPEYNLITEQKEGRSVSGIKLYSKHMCLKMEELGCPRAKSFIVEYPGWLRDDLQVHFIRGLFDGDGCLTYREKQKEWKFSIVGTKSMCEGVKEFFSKVGIGVNYRYISKTNNNTYEIEKSGNESILKICDILYKDSDSDIRLDRKYEKYLKLREQQNGKNNK